MRKILRKDSECFYALNKTGFFIRREGTTEERIAPVAIILAHHSDLARLKELMDLRPDGSSNETVADIWTNNLKQGEPIAIGLSLQLIDAAGDNRQRKSKTQIIGYAIDALRTSQCEAFLKERSFKIVSEHPGAFGVLTLAGLI